MTIFEIKNMNIRRSKKKIEKLIYHEIKSAIKQHGRDYY
jgi:hypothetical protein